jgi:hypothetical protein
MKLDTEAKLPTRFGDFRIATFAGDPEGKERSRWS